MYRKPIILMIILIFLLSSLLSSQAIIENNKDENNEEQVILTIYIFHPIYGSTFKKTINQTQYTTIKNIISNINNFNQIDTIIDEINNLNIIPESLTKDFKMNIIQSLSNYKGFSSYDLPVKNNIVTPLCYITGSGEGVIFPFELLPRPRWIFTWSGYRFNTNCLTYGRTLSGSRNFIAEGDQNGISIGFEGIGLTFPSYNGLGYFFTGFSTLTCITADKIYTKPYNFYIPEISNPNPINREIYVPVNLTELSFNLSDGDGDLMSYWVSTNPNIGSDGSNNVGNGRYSIDISGLEYSTDYSWTVEVNDRDYSTENTYHFRTISDIPIISESSPINYGSSSLNLNKLQFNLKDPDGDKMNYSVITIPDIGSGFGNVVSNGTYNISIDGLKNNTWYRWIVNVTDDTHTVTKKFSFYTGKSGLVGYWNFDEGWDTIAHDSSPYGNHGLVRHGIISGTIWTNNSISGNAIYSKNDYDQVEIPNHHSLNFNDTNEFTINTWVNLTDYSKTTYRVIVSKGDHPETSRGYGYGLIIKKKGYDTAQFRVYDANKTIYSVDGNIVVKDGKWHNIVGVWDHGDMYIYVDGILDNYSYHPIIIKFSGNLFIGANFYVQLYKLRGIVDEVTIFERALNENEIYDLYLYQSSLIEN